MANKLVGTVLVVGGNRGLGLELVKGLISQNLKVFVTCRKSDDTLKSIKGLYKIIDGIDLEDEKCGELITIWLSNLFGLKK